MTRRPVNYDGTAAPGAADRAAATVDIVEGGTLLEGKPLNPRARRTHGMVWTSTRHRPDEPRPLAVPADVGAESDAREALRHFLAGFGLGADEHGRKLIERLLAGARSHQRDHPEIGLAACATAYAEQRFEAWLRVVLAPELAAGQPALAAGRAAFLSCGGPTAWPELILVPNQLPDGFVSAMRAAMTPLAPMPAPATMPTQALESWSIVEIAHAALDLLGTTFAWAASARPLVTASIKLAKPWS